MLQSRCQSPPPMLSLYRSLVELRRLLNANDAGLLHVVVALDPHFAGEVDSLLLGRRREGELTLTVAGGPFPPLADWSFVERSQLLGWGSIRVTPDSLAAVRRAVGAPPQIRRVEVFWPAWRCCEDVKFILHQVVRTVAGNGTLTVYRESRTTYEQPHSGYRRRAADRRFPGSRPA